MGILRQEQCLRNGRAALAGAARLDRPIKSGAIVMQDAGCGRPLDAGDRAQILINRAQVVHGHALKFRPGHDLQEITVKGQRSGKAVRGNRGRARRMHMVQILAGLHDVEKLGKAAPTFRTPGLIRRQIPRDDVGRVRGQRAEVSSAAEIGCRIDNLWLPEKRIAAESILRRGALRVTVVARRHSVDEITSKSYQSPVLASQVQWNGGHFKSNADPWIVGLTSVVFRSECGRAAESSGQK